MANTVAWLNPSAVAPSLPASVSAPQINQVGGTVTTDGATLTVTITHDLVISVADLALGLPEVTFEPQSAAFYTIIPFVASKTANTIVLTVAGVVGTFGFTIKRPNTLVR